MQQTTRLAHELLGEAAIASVGHYPLGAMLLRPLATSGSRAIDRDTDSYATSTLVALQLLLYSGPCASDMRARLSAYPKDYIRLPLKLDPVAVQRDAAQAVRWQAGDLLFLPAIPTAVLVAGAVKSPGAIDFVSDADARDYIRSAGGWARGADRSETFVYLPNGERRPIRAAFWNYERRNVPPGSVIVVPGRNANLAEQFSTLRTRDAADGVADRSALPALRMDEALDDRRPSPSSRAR
ncbi:capsule biosynthesis GfcC family protein [Algiphilus sp.]|uniref:capsule biosynthesis GfcC family protein n=1 Tax=Algiphilus sp. TaxID=1872431 RepID=UPI003B523C7F